MNKSRLRAANRRQAGFTLVELLVVIAIIGMLMGLLLPAIGSMRGRARQAVCLNQIGQLAKGVINYHSSKQRYPGYVQDLKRSNGQFLEIQGANLSSAGFATTTNSNRSLVSWAAVILPQLERNDIYDVMVDANAPDAQRRIRPIEIFICPDDTELTSLPDNAGLTYVANTGYWDWYTSSGTLATNFAPSNYPTPGDSKANGVFHNLTLGSVRVRDIADGSSNTLMFSENIHKEVEATAVGIYTWAGATANGSEPQEPNSPAEQQFGMVWIESGDIDDNVVDNPFEDPDGNYEEGNPPDQFPFSVEGDTAEYFATTPLYARPASKHPQGSFNCAMMGGEAKAIAADIDYDVYQRLMTPEGRKAVRPWNGAPATTYLNLPLLSETDF